MTPLIFGLVPLILLITGSDGGTTSLPCQTAEHAHGCRAPFGLDIAYSGLFEPFCNTHSLCYSCGADHGHTKQSCDDALRSDLYTACETLSDPDRCKFQADNVYSLAVRVVGSSFFHSAWHTEPFCIEHWVPGCLPSVVGETSTAGVIGK